MRKVGSILLLCLVVLVQSCGTGINIQTGQTSEEAVEGGERRARAMRSEWSERLEPLSALDKARMLVSLVDSTTANFIRYGHQVADRWRSSNDELGHEQPGAAAREMIERGTREEMPVLNAYGDMARYALDEIRYAGHLGPDIEGMLARHVEFFNDVFRTVFNPAGMVDDYADRLREFELMGPELSAEVRAEL